MHKWGFLIKICPLSVAASSLLNFHAFVFFSRTTEPKQFNQNWHKAFLGERDSIFFMNKASRLSPRGDNKETAKIHLYQRHKASLAEGVSNLFILCRGGGGGSNKNQSIKYIDNFFKIFTTTISVPTKLDTKHASLFPWACTGYRMTRQYWLFESCYTQQIEGEFHFVYQHLHLSEKLSSGTSKSYIQNLNSYILL